MRVAIDGIDHDLVEQLDPRDGNPELDRGDDGLHRTFQRVERTDAAGDRLGQPVHAERDLSDDAERALRSDEEARQVVAR